MVTVIIPSLNPDEKLMQVVTACIEGGFNDIVLVNDGSDENHLEPFKQADQLKEVTVLTHDVNKGKGRGLKTAFEYCIQNRKDISGVITVDGDNQHHVDDIAACAAKMESLKDTVILGVRDFSGDDVPFKSRFGNNLTSGVFKVLCGMKISDTQTGLRAIPAQYLEAMCNVAGERFEYETNMLLTFKKLSIPYAEVPIRTVYINENETTHFHPIRDSFKIYSIIFKFVFGTLARFFFGSLSAFIIDIAIFALLKCLTVRLAPELSIFIATLVARVISSLYNFTFNRKIVFNSKEGVGSTMARYYILCVLQMSASYGLVYAVNTAFTLGNAMTVLAKGIIDTLLFLLSFQIQKRWVFRK